MNVIELQLSDGKTRLDGKPYTTIFFDRTDALVFWLANVRMTALRFRLRDETVWQDQVTPSWLRSWGLPSCP